MKCLFLRVVTAACVNATEFESRQVCVHKLLNHETIIKFYGFRKDGKIQYLFLEYASGGELFDRIGKIFYAPISVSMHCYGIVTTVMKFDKFYDLHISTLAIFLKGEMVCDFP